LHTEEKSFTALVSER